MVQTLWKTAWQYLLKLNVCSPYDPATELRHIHKGHKFIYPPEDLFKSVHNSFVIIATNWKQSKYLATRKWINKLWHICTMVWPQ